MRLHELTITAFGPFADTAHIDFDALSSAGLFLLTGATGAGKTSVLDAVCFALYGDVPGDRAAAKRLRSDQASPELAPRVELECTLSGRRFRVTRSPAWERPKRRGTGTTRQQPTVLVAELVADQWISLATRPDEAGQLISGLLGLTMTQFTQVAMLPQGRFQAFLRARSEDRHQLLQRLFRTDRFEQIERWLADRRLALGRSSRDHQHEVAGLASRLSEAAGTALPAAWDSSGLFLPAEDGSLQTWIAEVSGSSKAACRRRTAAAERVAKRLTRRQASLAAARELDRRQREHADALLERERLAQLEPEIAQVRQRIAAAQRADTVVSLLAVLDEATARREERSSRLADALAALALSPDDVPEDLATTLRAQRDDAGHRASVAAALVPRQARRRELTLQIQSWQADLARHRQRLVTLAEQQATMPARLAELAAQRERAAASRAQLPALSAELDRAESVVAAARTATRLTTDLERAEASRRAAVDAAQLAKERWLTIQERRITGMASALASQLAVGACCPVCGSADHPRPAQGASDLPDLADERAARALVDDAEATRIAHDDEVRELASRLARAAAVADGASVEHASLARDRAAQALAAAHSVAAEWSAADAALEEAESLDRELGDRLREARDTHARLDSAIVTATSELADIDQALAREFPEAEDQDLTLVREQALARRRQLEDALEAAQDAHAASASWVTAHRRATDRARQAGFPDVEAALAAHLDEDSRTSLRDRVAAHDAAVAHVGDRLADAQLSQAATEPPPDLTELEREFAALEQLAQTARARAELATSRASRVAELTRLLRRAEDAWAPVRAEWEIATRLAGLAEGKSLDNRLQMRLSAYVLAHRLSQVVVAANTRLASMSDSRYHLEHTGRRGAGETRGGLSLLVRDDWSGEARDPATLSGGETFLVSLALALGLADVIAHEVGGADLDTLFVDEGFGSLDADTLDDVLDTLDSLRDGGRVVGVVSHVTEMRDRIPAQLSVLKSRRGSTVSLAAHLG